MTLNYHHSNYHSGYPELDSDIGPSELSDIAEEPEDGLTDEDDEDEECVTPKPMAKLQPATTASSTYLSSSSSYGSRPKPAWRPSVAAMQLDSPSQFTAQPLTSTTYIKQDESAAAPSSGTVRVTANGLEAASENVAANNNNNNSNNNSGNNNNNKQERVRIFVALFDYDPQTMSPNPDSCDEELPFRYVTKKCVVTMKKFSYFCLFVNREGQLIKIIGEKDGDGFYWGEAVNRTGYVKNYLVSCKHLNLSFSSITVLCLATWCLKYKLTTITSPRSCSRSSREVNRTALLHLSWLRNKNRPLMETTVTGNTRNNIKIICCSFMFFLLYSI